MPKFQDLTGQRFGDLVVLRRGPDYVSPTGKKTVQWVCRCEACGREVTMLRNTLKEASSCGCRKGDKLRKDLTGQRFGRWTVLERVRRSEPRPNGSWTDWLCRCDCGTERLVDAKSLTTGASRSCGCATAEKAARRIEPDKENVLQRYDGTVVSKLRPGKTLNANNQSGVNGVYWSAREQCWIAKIGLQNKSITIGRFASLAEAKKARIDAEVELYDPIIEAFDDESREAGQNIRQRKCRGCGQWFSLISGHLRYCPDCRESRSRSVPLSVPVPCNVCGREFVRTSPAQKACPNCREAARQEVGRRMNTPYPCIRCGNPFLRDKKARKLCPACRAKTKKD